MIEIIDKREVYSSVDDEILALTQAMSEKPKGNDQPQKIVRFKLPDFSKVPQDEFMAAYSPEDFDKLFRKYDPEYQKDLDEATEESDRIFRELMNMVASIDVKREFQYVVGRASKQDVEMIDMLRDRHELLDTSLEYYEDKYIEFDKDDDALWMLMLEDERKAEASAKRMRELRKSVFRVIEKNPGIKGEELGEKIRDEVWSGYRPSPQKPKLDQES